LQIVFIEALVHPTYFDFGLLRPGGGFDGTDTMQLRQPIGSKEAVLAIPDILVRIRIRTSD
jgi:hypothetical protein